MTDEPSVLTWRIALAPRPRFTTNGRHWWRELVHQAWFSATQVWLAEREAVAIGYATEQREYEEAHPRPRLRDFMVELSTGQADLYDLAMSRSAGGTW